MSYIETDHSPPSNSRSIHGARRAALPVRSMLPDKDRRHLGSYLARCDVAKRPFLAHVLRLKHDAPPVMSGDLPGDVVIGGSQVTYKIGDGPAQRGLLSHRVRSGARIGDGTGVIAVKSLLGATLIGMRVGQRAPLLRDDGTIVSVSVLETALQG